MSKQDNTLRLSDARQATPPVNSVEAMRKQLALGVFGVVKEKDVSDLVAKLHQMAMEGDHKAMKMYFELVGVMGQKEKPAAPPPSSEAGLKMMAEAIKELVDEIRVGKARASQKRIANGAGTED